MNWRRGVASSAQRGHGCSCWESSRPQPSHPPGTPKPDLPRMRSERETGFDVIIVGSGSSGSVLACRLTEYLPQLRVLLLEAGRDHRTADMSPEMKAVNPMGLWADPQWTDASATAKRTATQSHRLYPVGRCLGGGSSMNGMGAIRASSQDFKEWKVGWKLELGDAR